MRRFRPVFLWTCLLILSVYHLSCSRTTDEDRIRDEIRKIEKSVEDKKIAQTLKYISRGYRDPQGYDYDGIKGLLLMYFYRHQRISVYITGLEISSTGDSAVATFEAVLSGAKDIQSPSDILPEAMGIYGFEVGFKKEEGVWKITSAKWERRALSAP